MNSKPETMRAFDSDDSYLALFPTDGKSKTPDD